MEDMLEYYDVELIGEEKFSGRDCYVLNLKPKEGEGNIKLWVDKEYWYPIRIEIKDNFGMKTVTEYRNVEFNIPIEDSIFKFQIPESAEVRTMDDSPRHLKQLKKLRST